MNTHNQNTAIPTTVFNLIILDESGSMHGVKQQTIDGCNEVLNTIRSAQKKDGNARRQLVSIYVFQDNDENPSHYLVKNKPIGDVKNVTHNDYNPWGCTPLLDAMGMTIVDVNAVASTHMDATGVVTLITDGMENASVQYTAEQVAKMVSAMTEKGWNFNVIGANIDVNALAKNLKVQNAMSFHASQSGTKVMFDEFAQCYNSWNEESRKECGMKVEERIELRKSRASSFFRKK